MAAKDVVVRLVSPAGRSRITLPPGSTFAQLQEKVKVSTGVEPGVQSFAFDREGKRPLSGASTSPISTLGISNGTELHLVNKEASIAAQVLTKVLVPVEPEQKVDAAGAGGAAGSSGAATSSSSSAAASSSAPAPAPAPKPDPKNVDSFGRPLPSASAPAAAPKAAAKNVDSFGRPLHEDSLKLDPKFMTFDAFIRGRRYDIAALPGAQKFVTTELKQGGQMKMPPSVSIKQQQYRHVDNLSVMSVPEIEHFIGYWTRDLLENAMQRMGWMYGYYTEDPNYDEGTRAVLEGIYEPPQDMNGEYAMPHDDPHRKKVDLVAEALGLECIGWIFTTLPLDDGMITSSVEVQKVARLQNDYSTNIHFTKYDLSKFVSCAVRPDASLGGQPNLCPFMVSDQACAIVRDGLMSENPDPKNCVIRDAGKKEIVSDFLVEGKSNKKILTDFFVVRMNDGVPKKIKSIFTHHDFPRENRPNAPQRRDDLKSYFRNRPTSEVSWSRFADFHLLLYIAKELDVDMAIDIAKSVTDREEVKEGHLMMIQALMQ